MAAEPRDLEPGDTFAGRYEVLDLLGKGGFGSVYLVQNEIGWRLALKVLHSNVLAPTNRKRFLEEMQIARTLYHENAVPIRDAGEHEGIPYFTMEYVRGQTMLDSIKHQGRIPPPHLVAWGDQVLSFLSYFHGLHHVHRDVKPANLMLEQVENRQERVRVLDLGIAKKLHEETAISHETFSSALVGTPVYMAPEQIRFDGYDHRTDLYSLGVTLYECATGRVPFRASTVDELCRRIVHDEPTPIHHLVPSFPLTLEKVILRALQKKPADRYETARSFQDDLRVVFAGDTRHNAATVAFDSRSGRRQRRLLAGLALVLVASLPLGYLLYPWSSEPVGPIPARQAATTEREATSEPVRRESAPPVPPPARLEVSRLVPADATTVGRSVDIELRVGGEPPFEIAVAGRTDTLAQPGTWRGHVELRESGTRAIPVKVTDASGQVWYQECSVACDLDAPTIESLTPAGTESTYYTFDDTEPVDVEIVANEALGSDTTIDGSPATVDGHRARATVTRGSSSSRKVVLALADALGNKSETFFELARSRLPAGLEPIPGRTGRDAFGSPWATPLREPRTGMVLVLVPPTSSVAWQFCVGAVEDDLQARDSEHPRRAVTISSPFYLGATEVTWAQWQAVPGSHLRRPEDVGPDHPVFDMTWAEGREFAAALGLRLPTEAEWEWAARCENGRADGIYPWSGGIDAGRGLCNVRDVSYARHLGIPVTEDLAPFDDTFATTAPAVGSAGLRPLQRLGLCNLIGNVWEWCEDAFTDSLYPTAPASSTLIDPIVRGDERTVYHVARGGSYKYSPAECRISRRLGVPGQRVDVGLRLARSVDR